MRRGATILEVMVAGAVLMLGLVGVLQLIISAAGASRRGSQSVSASFQAQDVLYQFIGSGFDGGGLVPGSYDAGTVIEPDGRRLTREVLIMDATNDAGYPSFDIITTVRWTTGLTQHEVQSQALISLPPPPL